MVKYKNGANAWRIGAPYEGHGSSPDCSKKLNLGIAKTTKFVKDFVRSCDQ